MVTLPVPAPPGIIAAIETIIWPAIPRTLPGGWVSTIDTVIPAQLRDIFMGLSHTQVQDILVISTFIGHNDLQSVSAALIAALVIDTMKHK